MERGRGAFGRLWTALAAGVLWTTMAHAEEAHDPAAMVSLSVAAVNDEDVATALRSRFDQHVDYGNVTSLAGDVTCDSVGDVVVTYWNPASPAPPVLHLMVVTYAMPAAGGVGAASLVVDLPFSDSLPFAVCGKPRRVAVALEEWSQADVKEIFAIPICRTAIRIEDTGCDGPRLFWITDDSQNGRIAFYRN